MSEQSRRDFIVGSGAALAAGSIATMLLARQAPAQLRGTTLRMVMWSHFVPAYDQWFDKFARDWGEKNGVRVMVDHIPNLELPSRYAAEFAAGSGHDLIHFAAQILTGHYHRHLVDVSDVAERIGKSYGGWMPAATSAAQVDGVWYAVPDYFVPIPVLWRKDLFDQNNLPEPDTWDKLRVAARTLKAKGHPTGIQFSHCNDANHNWRAVLYCFGARETDPSGRQIMLDSKETREALRFAKALYEEGMTSEVFSWDDASDNRYLASGVACWIHDAISAYRTSQDTNPEVFKNTYILPEAAGPGGLRRNVGEPTVWAIWQFSKNVPAAKDFVAYLADHQPDAMTASRGFNMPFLMNEYQKPMPVIGTDPKLNTLQDVARITAFFGYPGPMTPPAQEVVTSFVIPDVFTRVARGESVDDAVNWGVGEIRRIYGKYRMS
jgi:multiple sugar transport system substrate-binding protein